VPATAAAATHHARRWLGFAGVWLLLDLLTKWWAMVALKTHHSISLLGDLLRLTYMENRGMAFSLAFLPPWVLTAVALVAAVYISLLLWRKNFGWWKNLSLALVLAGALGNAIDRIRFGYVIDFIDSDFPDWIIERWPIFNLADSGVTVGMVLLAAFILFEKSPKTGSSGVATNAGSE